MLFDAFNFSDSAAAGSNRKPALTLQKRWRKSNDKVLPFPNNHYARLRRESAAPPLLHERGEPPPEHLLQAVWQHQRLLRDQLESLDGESIRILHPGFLNREGGPDFRGAIIQIGRASPIVGDVEVDVCAGGWRAHGHDRNPAFVNVILHVIWDGDRTAFGDRASGGPTPGCPDRGRPKPATLKLRQVLDAPLAALNLWLNSEAAEKLPENLRGKCTGGLRELSPEQLSALLREAAAVRFRNKAGRIQARARQTGWEQALWEGLFRALGYKHNTWPMHCLAEQRPQWLSAQLSPLELQARLLGISGLMPRELTRRRSSADEYVRRIWDQWWREREEFQDCLLPVSLWRFHGQRPANHPQRRLALATHWLASPRFVANLERWCATRVPDGRLAGSLMEILQIGSDDFWSWHWTLGSSRLKKPQPLLGLARVTDLAVNVILPWLWLRAAEGKNRELQQAIEHRFNVWPAAEDNSVLRLARQRLLNGASPRILRSAAEQQGLIQIVSDFCDHSNAACEQCAFPRVIKEWSSAGRNA